MEYKEYYRKELNPSDFKDMFINDFGSCEFLKLDFVLKSFLIHIPI